MSGCYLFSHKVKLPEWGFEQQEVTCNKQAVKPNSLWYIETAIHPMLPEDAPKVNYKLPGFFAKFLELQQVMWTTNAGLTDRHTFDSRPDAWPRLRRGINFWVRDRRQIYLLGNPMVWWLSTAAVFSYIMTRGFLILRAKRGYRDFENTKVVKYDSLCGFLFMGWCLHYFPFFLMGRQLFLHHYFPALYFAILLSCGVFDLVTSALKPRVRLQIAAVLLIIAIWNFVYLSPIAYGGKWTKAKCNNARWLKTWDFACNEFYDDYSQYDTTLAAATPQKSSPAVAAVHGDAGRPVLEDRPDDHMVDIPPPDSAETTIDFGQAEPGRDIFSGVPHEDLKSSEVPDVPEEKEISMVDVQQPTSIPEAFEDVAQPVADQEEAVVAHEVEHGTGTAASDEPLPTVDDDIAVDPVAPLEDEPVKIQGAMLEDEAEADRARHELFPDADVD